MKLVVIRHGETYANIVNNSGKILYTGGLDTEYTNLTEKGIQVASELNNNEFVRKIDKLYASDLKRAIKTASLVRPDLDINVDKRLRERSLGIFEGHDETMLENNEELKKYLYDENYNKFRADFFQKAPEGENYTEVFNRVKSFIDDLTNEYGDTDLTIGLVSHFNTIKCMFLYLFNITPKEKCIKLKIDNAVPFVIDYDSENNTFILVSHKLEDITK